MSKCKVCDQPCYPGDDVCGWDCQPWRGMQRERSRTERAEARVEELVSLVRHIASVVSLPLALQAKVEAVLGGTGMPSSEESK